MNVEFQNLEDKEIIPKTCKEKASRFQTDRNENVLTVSND